MNRVSDNKAPGWSGMKPQSHERILKTIAGRVASASEPCSEFPNPRSLSLPNRSLTSRTAPRGRRRGRTAVGGFSLIELMIAMAIGVILMIALTDLLVDVKSTFVREDQFARLQEGARISALLASRHLRSTRSLGCRSLAMVEHEGSFTVKACKLLDTAPGNKCNHADWQSDAHFLTMDRALGYDNSADLSSAANLSDLPPSGASNIAARWLRGDILVTWGVDGEGALVTKTVNRVVGKDGGFLGRGRFKIAAPTEGVKKQGKLALVTDCVGADLFEISGPKVIKKAIAHNIKATDDGEDDDDSDSDRVNASRSLSRAYNWSDATAGRQLAQTVHRAKVYPFSYNAYYICCVDSNERSLQTGADVANCNKGDLDRFRPSLCAWSLEDEESQPLITDVADMRVTYTGDADGDGALDFFADDTGTVPTAAWVSGEDAWPNVRSAAVELLVTTAQDGVVTKSKAPASSAWPPGSGDGAVAVDTLGKGLPQDRRLYERFVINVATRSRTPWYIAP